MGAQLDKQIARNKLSDFRVEALEALRAALIAGEERGPSTDFSFEQYLALKRAQREATA